MYFFSTSGMKLFLWYNEPLSPFLLDSRSFAGFCYAVTMCQFWLLGKLILNCVWLLPVIFYWWTITCMHSLTHFNLLLLPCYSYWFRFFCHSTFCASFTLFNSVKVDFHVYFFDLLDDYIHWCRSMGCAFWGRKYTSLRSGFCICSCSWCYCNSKAAESFKQVLPVWFSFWLATKPCSPCWHQSKVWLSRTGAC